MAEFNPGDRVRIVSYPDLGVEGMVGTVRKKPVHPGGWYIVNTDDALPQEMWEYDDTPEHDLFVYTEEVEAI